MTDDVFGIVGSTQAGMFRVDRVVAEGGFAVVYQAYHEGFRAPVALKCLKVPDTMTDANRAAFLEKFREEGELLFRLSALEPAVVRPLHVDVLMLGHRLVPFLALEWLEGEALDQRIEARRLRGKAPIEIGKLCPFLQPAARALAQAHRVPGPDGPIAIIHRDIKPENLFVAQAPGGEVVKVLDFGIARTVRAAQLDAQHDASVAAGNAPEAFTPGYAAPEQWLPKSYGQVGPWTDVFGMALTMVEVLAGRQIFRGDVRALANQTLDPDRRPTPRAVGVAVSDAVERAFARALAVDPRARTQSIVSFWTELEGALGLPPSLAPVDTHTPARRLTGGGTEPPPTPPRPLPPRAFAPTAVAPPPIRVGLRKPEGELPPASAGSSRPPAPIAIELAPAAMDAPPSYRPAHLPPPSDRAPRPIELAGARPREEGTLATAPRWGAREASDLREQLRAPLGMVLMAIAITVADSMYTHRTGELFTMGPARPAWVAVPLALLGVALACWRVLGAM